ncbi:hypothetical protein FOCG_18117 [Fusarium oxysporum f. sp. radicis-lycopersici 26381]|nr:hypothetical protein FOCG_18117 [Fusarium oxysporum f. sp. radicis-lycopersici 26381]
MNAASYPEVCAWIVGLFWFITFVTSQDSPKVKGAPIVGKKFWLEPSVFQRLRFTTQSRHVLQDAYDKFKDRIFVVRRVDRDINVLPAKYLDEMRSLPRPVMNGTIPQVLNLCAKYTSIHFMLTSDLLLRVINNKLTPDLTKYVDMAKVEMDYSFTVDLPQPDDWIEFDIQAATRNIISRMSSKIFLGYPACRNQDWIDMSIQFTADLFGTAFILKHFPEWMRPFVSPFIPHRYRMKSIVERGKKIVGEQIDNHRNNRANEIETEDTLLAWMLDNGTAKEYALEEMTQRQLLLVLASIHTTTMATANFLFDLCTHPEYFSVLRDEIKEVTEKYGRIGENKDISAKIWLTKLEKMDSFLIESQRFEPSVHLKPQRVALQEINLKDGTVIPKGAMIAWAGHQHANDPLVNQDPGRFDPMRAYRKRYANNKAEFNKYVAGVNETSSLAFGYGNQACPGRYFAVNELKLMLSRLVAEYDFALPKGAQRPKSFDVEENIILDKDAKILMRSRKI